MNLLIQFCKSRHYVNEFLKVIDDIDMKIILENCKVIVYLRYQATTGHSVWNNIHRLFGQTPTPK